MRFVIEQATLQEYDAGAPGITVPVRLVVGGNVQRVAAKLDTGSSYCIFRRGIGEALGLDIERGVPQYISTVTGSFLTYGHEVTLLAFEFEFHVTAFFAHDPAIARDVLGRFGCLQLVTLGLVDYEGKLFVAPYDAL